MRIILRRNFEKKNFFLKKNWRKKGEQRGVIQMFLPTIIHFYFKITEFLFFFGGGKCFRQNYDTTTLD